MGGCSRQVLVGCCGELMGGCSRQVLVGCCGELMGGCRQVLLGNKWVAAVDRFY